MARGFVAIDELQVVGGLAGGGAPLRRLFLFVAGELQRAARVPSQRRVFLPLRDRIEERGPRQAREHAVVGRRDRMERARVVSGGFSRGLGVLFVQRDFPAARAEAFTNGGAGEACADYVGFSLWSYRFLRAAWVSGAKHFPLVAEARAFVDFPSGRFERMAHRGGDAPGGRGRAGRGEARERAH